MSAVFQTVLHQSWNQETNIWFRWQINVGTRRSEEEKKLIRNRIHYLKHHQLNIINYVAICFHFDNLRYCIHHHTHTQTQSQVIISFRSPLFYERETDQSHRETIQTSVLKIKARIENMNENEFFVFSFCSQHRSPSPAQCRSSSSRLFAVWRTMKVKEKKHPAKNQKQSLQFFNCASHALGFSNRNRRSTNREKLYFNIPRTHSGHTERMAIDAEKRKTRN